MATASGDPGPGSARRRKVFTRRNDQWLDPALEEQVKSINVAILDRLERGLSEIETNARTLMREAVEDTWRGNEAELKELRERVMGDLSRDQALRGLISHADERYQSIDISVGRIEKNLSSVELAADTLTELLGDVSATDGSALAGLKDFESRMTGLEGSLDGIRESSHLMQERLEAGLTAIKAVVAQSATIVQGADGHPVAINLSPIAERLASVQDYIGEVVEYLSARDQALVEWIQGIAKHTDGVVVAESARVEEALNSRFDLAALENEAKLREVVAQQVAEINERLLEQARTVGEAVSIVEAKAVASLQDQDGKLTGQSRQLEAMASRLEVVRQAAVDAAERVSIGLHERLAELADQMRAESEDMRTRLVERAGAAGAEAVRDIDERLGRLAELVQTALGGPSTRSTSASTARSSARYPWAWPTSSRSWTAGSPSSGTRSGNVSILWDAPSTVASSSPARRWTNASSRRKTPCAPAWGRSRSPSWNAPRWPSTPRSSGASPPRPSRSPMRSSRHGSCSRRPWSGTWRSTPTPSPGSWTNGASPRRA